MISGFLLWNDNPEKFQQRLTKNIKNIAWITFWAELLYFAYKFLQAIHQNTVAELFSVAKLKGLIFFSTSPFSYHLWYLYAYLYALIIVYFFSHAKILSTFKYLTPLLLILSFVLQKYALFIPFISNDYHLPRALFYALPFFTIGLAVKKYQKKINIKPTTAFACTTFFIICSFTEYYLFRDTGIEKSEGIYLSTGIYAFFLFLTTILASSTKETWFSNIGRDLSLYIYIFHYMIGWIMCLTIIRQEAFPNTFWTLLLVVVSILVSWLFGKVRDLFYIYLKLRNFVRNNNK